MTLRRLILAIAALIALTTWAEPTPRYIFYFIGDGMGTVPVQATQNYLRQVYGDTTGLRMLRFPIVSQAMTWSASTPVTDSAAAGTALSTGHKTKNGMLGMTPDTVAVNSIASVLHDLGWGVGLVTTVAPDDATPGAFYAHVPSRRMHETIGRQYAESGYEFLAGSAMRGAVDKAGNDTGLMQAIADAGIAVTMDPDSVKLIDSRRVLLLNRNNLNNDNVGFTIDSLYPHNTLPQMTAAAIDHLKRVSPDRFFMMVEGGNIDHALHANDVASAILDIITLDNTLQLALDFMNEHPDETLIVVTADHDTGGLGLGNDAVRYNNYPAMLLNQKISIDRMSDLFSSMMRSRRVYEWDDIRQFLKENLGFFDGIEITAEEEADLQQTFNEVVANRAADRQTLYASLNALIDKAAGLLTQKAGYGFTSTGHTGNPVPVMATGTGAESFARFSNNIDIPRRILEIVGETFPE